MGWPRQYRDDSALRSPAQASGRLTDVQGNLLTSESVEPSISNAKLEAQIAQMGGLVAQYSIRVELHKADYPTYELLHKAMWKSGFRRVVQGKDGKLYLLPTGSYIIATLDATDVVYNKAKAVATSTGKGYWIWLVRWDDARFFLPEVGEDPDAPKK
jgi:hypothetical protein